MRNVSWMAAVALGVVVIGAGCTSKGGGTAQATGGPAPTVTTGLSPTTGLASNFALKVPTGWEVTNDCSGATALLCSYRSGDSAQDLWFNTDDAAQKVTVITCDGASCTPVDSAGSLVFPPPVTGATGKQTLSSVAVRYHLPDQATETVTQEVVASKGSGGRPVLPLFSVTVDLPASQQALADAILGTFQVGPSGLPSPGQANSGPSATP